MRINTACLGALLLLVAEAMVAKAGVSRELWRWALQRL